MAKEKETKKDAKKESKKTAKQTAKTIYVANKGPAISEAVLTV